MHLTFSLRQAADFNAAVTMYRIQQFARLAGVTVRTLHHYDRVGLLSPTRRSESGYRIYCNEDLGKLERILVLRYLGLSLREIGELLRESVLHRSLQETLARQARVLSERRAEIDRVLRAVNGALAQANAPNIEAAPDWRLYQSILKEMQMSKTENWTEKYYSPEALEAVEQRKNHWSPELQAKVTADWQAMYADVQSALDRRVDPKSGEGQALAARWMALVGQFTGGNPEVLKGLNKFYADRSNWPQQETPAEQRANLPKPEHMAFIQAAQR